MKKIGIITLSTIAGLLLVSSAFAGSSKAGTSKTINITSAVTLNGKSIPEGEYKVSVADDGQVTIAQGKKILATAQGKLVERDAKASTNTFVTNKQSDGSYKLTEINFAGQKTAVVFAESDSKASGN
jgi:hypothetical protein